MDMESKNIERPTFLLNRVVDDEHKKLCPCSNYITSKYCTFINGAMNDWQFLQECQSRGAAGIPMSHLYRLQSLNQFKPDFLIHKDNFKKLSEKTARISRLMPKLGTYRKKLLFFGNENIVMNDSRGELSKFLKGNEALKGSPQEFINQLPFYLVSDAEFYIARKWKLTVWDLHKNYDMPTDRENYIGFYSFGWTRNEDGKWVQLVTERIRLFFESHYPINVLLLGISGNRPSEDLRREEKRILAIKEAVEKKYSNIFMTNEEKREWNFTYEGMEAERIFSQRKRKKGDFIDLYHDIGDRVHTKWMGKPLKSFEGARDKYIKLKKKLGFKFSGPKRPITKIEVKEVDGKKVEIPVHHGRRLHSKTPI